MFAQILEWIQYTVEVTGPIGICIATFIESLIAPIPSEIILITAGTTLNSPISLLIFIIASTLGSYLGTLPFYLIGSRSRSFVLAFFGKYGKYFFIDTQEIEASEEKFKKYGKAIIFFGRLIPGVRSIISIPAGIAKIDFKLYSIYTVVGSFLWNTLLLGAGYLLRDRYQGFIYLLDEYEHIVWIILTIILLLYALLHLKKSFKK